MTPGFASVAAAVVDHNAHPVAGVAVTYPFAEAGQLEGVVAAVRRTADTLTERLGGTRGGDEKVVP